MEKGKLQILNLFDFLNLLIQTPNIYFPQIMYGCK